jgi:hypothetical protein
VRNNTGNQRHTPFFEDTPARLLTKLDKAPKNSASFFDHAQLKTRMSRLLLSQIKKETNKLLMSYLKLIKEEKLLIS